MRAITSFKVLLRSNVRKLFGQVTVKRVNILNLSHYLALLKKVKQS